jgi:3-deoxy-manno-octulosonate cytidylyltransferase (CMP-KDO synthetase)
MIGGKTMIEHVYRQASKALDHVYVATDDDRIYSTVNDFGGNAIMTLDTHQSGTDRIAEAVTILQQRGCLFDVVINIQGDEPFINPRQIQSLKECFDTPQTHIATLIESINSREILFNPNSPKVIINEQSFALYFSRHPVPYIRGHGQDEWLDRHTFYKHIGIYAYRSRVLLEIAKLPPSRLEIAESLEQLRWLENNYQIKCALTHYEGIAVDTPEDLMKAQEWFENNHAT